MRHIEFRGKTRDGIWRYGYYAVIGKEHLILGGDAFSEERDGYECICCGCYEYVIPETVGQFTGEFDENKVEIFEGDIVRGKNGFGEIATTEVRYSGGSYYPMGENELYWTDLEVIGNIHDNPELIKEQK